MARVASTLPLEQAGQAQGSRSPLRRGFRCLRCAHTALAPGLPGSTSDELMTRPESVVSRLLRPWASGECARWRRKESLEAGVPRRERHTRAARGPSSPGSIGPARRSILPRAAVEASGHGALRRSVRGVRAPLGRQPPPRLVSSRPASPRARRGHRPAWSKALDPPRGTAEPAAAVSGARAPPAEAEPSGTVEDFPLEVHHVGTDVLRTRAHHHPTQHRFGVERMPLPKVAASTAPPARRRTDLRRQRRLPTSSCLKSRSGSL